MLANESRLFKAAKRTFRAEITLIIVIIVITSWSVYALCKYSFGVSDTVLGLPINPAPLPSPPPAPAQSPVSPIIAVPTAKPEPEQTASRPINNESQSAPTTRGLMVTNNPVKLTNYPAQSFASLSSASSSLPTHNIEPQQSLIYSPHEAKYNWNQLLQDLAADRDSEAIRNADSARPSDKLRSFQAQAHYMRPTDESDRFDPELDGDIDALKNVAQKPVSGSSGGYNGEPLLQQRRRHYRTIEKNVPEQYGRSRKRRRHQGRVYNAPGVEEISQDLTSYRSSDQEEPPKSLEASLDELEDLPPPKSDSAEDKDQKVEEYSDEDRQVAESSRDPSELLVKHGADDVDGGDNTQSDVAETTTETPSSADEESTSKVDEQEMDGNGQQENSENQVTETTPEPNGGQVEYREEHSDEPDQTDEQAAKSTGDSIDEEVDRMTQPSLGVASRQEKPFDYKNTVQFDDLATNGGDANALVSGLLNERLTPLSDARSKNKRSDSNNNFQESGHVSQKLANDNSSRGSSSNISNSTQKKSYNSLRAASDEPPATRGQNSRSRLGSRTREKRSIRPEVETIKAPYEIDKFLDGLNFGSLTGKPVISAQKRRSRALINDLTAVNSTRNPVSVEQNSTAIEPILDENSKQIDMRLNPNLNFLPHYRKDSDDQLANPMDYDDGTALDSRPALNRSSLADKNRKSPSNKYRYLKSNDTGLQELIKKKELLNVLKQSKLPAPFDSGGKSNKSSSNDHSTADSLFTVDHGLLLYPSSDEEHSHHEKSMSKKKKKHESKKAKKKSMIAIKKGGHKKKKHKKEEKKFHKEKKFKGAKKGKKMSKGKGGQGGKKGKKHYKDKGFKKKGFKNVYHKEEFGQKKSYFDEYRDKDFKKKWKKYDDKYNYAQMKKWQAKDVKKAKKMKDHGMKYKKYDKSRYKKKHQSHEKKHSQSSSKKKKSKGMDF